MTLAREGALLSNSLSVLISDTASSTAVGLSLENCSLHISKSEIRRNSAWDALHKNLFAIGLQLEKCSLLVKS
jgi:hypothetical protein